MPHADPVSTAPALSAEQPPHPSPSSGHLPRCWSGAVGAVGSVAALGAAGAPGVGGLRLWGLLGAGVLVGLAVALVPEGGHAQSAATSPGAAAPKPSLTVVVQPPQRSTWAHTLTASGTVTAWQEASVSAQANGLRLTELRAQVGERVRAGQVLAVFDADTVRAELAQAQAALAEAQATATEAQGNAERARNLQATGAMSAQQIAQYTTAAVTAQARVESAQAQRAVQQLRLKQAQVLAPDAGVVVARSATVGAVVPAGTELFRLIRQGRLEWRAEVGAADLERIRVGQGVALRTPGGAVVRGKVRTLGPTVDAQTRTALVYVDVLADPSGGLRAGMFATGDIALGESPATTVPQQAVVNRDGFTYVFVLDAAAAGTTLPTDPVRVSRLKVQTGRRVGDRVEVLAGLPDGMPRIVTQGAGFLNDGDGVRVVQPVAVPAVPVVPAGAEASAVSKGMAEKK